MEVIKRKILLEDYISRKPSNWGELTADAFYVNVMFTQDADDMGIGTDMPFVSETPDYTPLTEKLIDSGLTFNFMNGGSVNITENGYSPNTRFTYKTHDDYYLPGIMVSGMTEDRIDTVRSYIVANPLNPGFNMKRETYDDYQGDSVDGITGVISINGNNPLKYVNDGDVNESTLGTRLQRTGLYFESYTGETRLITNALGEEEEIPVTRMFYHGQGVNETNSLLSANTKEEYLYGITTTPQVYSDVDIDRGANRIIQSHLQLGEIRNMGDLINYGNGFYKIRK